MNYLGLGVVGRAGARLVSSCKDLYNDLNGANLTGAVDVVVVQQMDGTYKSTPFHVRFGKWGVLRTGDLQKEVEVEVNGELVHNRMMLDENGSAFFVKPNHSMSIDNVPNNSSSDIIFPPRSHSMSSVPDTFERLPENETVLEYNTDTPQLVKSHDKDSLTIVFERVEQETNEGVAHGTGEGVAHSTSGGVAHGTGEGVAHGTGEGVAHSTSGGVAHSTSGGVAHDTGEGVAKDNDNQQTHFDSLTDTPLSDTVTLTRNLLKDDSIEYDFSKLGVISDECAKRHVSKASNSSENQSSSYIELQIRNDKCDKESVYLTPTDNPDNFDWLVQQNTELSNQLCEELDRGVMSDSAVELHKKKFRHINVTLSDSELEERHDIDRRTEGETTSSTKTNDDTIVRSQQSPDDVPRYSLWGAIRGIWSRKGRRRFSSIEEGIYLDDLDNGVMGDEEKALYLPPTAKNYIEEDTPSDSSGIDTSSPLFSPVREMTSPVKNLETVIDLLSNIQLSQCGLTDGINEQLFTQSQISFDEFCSNPDLLTSSNIVVKLNGKYYSWSVAGPMIISALLYQQPLPNECQNNLEKRHALKNKSKQSLWRLWSNETSEEKFGKTENDSSVLLDYSNDNLPTVVRSLPPTHLMREDPLSSDEEDEQNQQQRTMSRVRQRSLRRKRFIFTNQLTSDELSRWPLKPGKNELVFSITTKYQGTARANCSLYLWNYDEKIVVSDFDGTITRSDVAGQVLPFLGKDWTHFGVIELFSAIHDNGYKFLYLSARAIGQSMYTKNYLRSTRSRDCYLPDGPLLVTPFSLYKAFKKEVIERKPEEFKILCLQQIKTFFPEEYNPFHAGFGNKPSDAKSYFKVNISPSRIFTVNPKGEIKHELSWTFQSSYAGLMDFVDGQFPSLLANSQAKNNILVTDNNNGTDSEDIQHGSIDSIQPLCVHDDNFSSFLFWKHSFNSFDSYDLPDII